MTAMLEAERKLINFLSESDMKKKDRTGESWESNEPAPEGYVVIPSVTFLSWDDKPQRTLSTKPRLKMTISEILKRNK